MVALYLNRLSPSLNLDEVGEVALAPVEKLGEGGHEAVGARSVCQQGCQIVKLVPIYQNRFLHLVSKLSLPKSFQSGYSLQHNVDALVTKDATHRSSTRPRSNFGYHSSSEPLKMTFSHF